MNSYVKKGLYCGLFVAGLTLLGATAANAAETSGDDSVAGGNLVDTVLQLPVTIVDNAVSIVGDSSSTAAEPAAEPVAEPAAEPASGAEPAEPTATSGDDSVAGGNQVDLPISVPIEASGNAVSVVGDAASSAPAPAVEQAAPAAPAPAAPAPAAPAPANSGAATSGDESVAGGNQVAPTVTIPITISGNGISVLGDSESDQSSTAPAGTSGSGTGDGAAAPATSGEDGLLGGNQILPNVSIPVTVTGNAISVLGDSESSQSGSAPAGASSGTGGNAAAPVTSGDDGLLGGNQVLADVLAPITATGNAISVVGDSSSSGTGSGTGTTPQNGTSGGTNGGSITSGDDGLLGGNQVLADIGLPITVGGNAISVIGDSTTEGPGTGPVGPTDPTDPTDPTGPTDPVDPTDPGTPVTPVTPSVPSTTVTTTASVPAFASARTAGGSSGSGAPALADTGVEATALFGAVTVLLLLGAAAFLIGRRRSDA